MLVNLGVSLTSWPTNTASCLAHGCNRKAATWLQRCRWSKPVKLPIRRLKPLVSIEGFTALKIASTWMHACTAWVYTFGPDTHPADEHPPTNYLSTSSVDLNAPSYRSHPTWLEWLTHTLDSTSQTCVSSSPISLYQSKTSTTTRPHRLYSLVVPRKS